MIGTKRTRHAARGFTLIELLVVIIILAILAAVVIPRVIGRTEDAKISSAMASIKSLDTAFKTYNLDNGSYPTTDQGLAALVTNVANSDKWHGPYVEGAIPNDPWGNPFIYAYPGTHGTDYDLFSAGPDKQPGTGDDICNWSLHG